MDWLEEGCGKVGGDPALRVPWKYRMWSVLVLVPALGLAVLGGWTLALDRRTAESEARTAAGALATALGQEMARGDRDQVGDHFPVELKVTREGLLAWPPPGVWPPQPKLAMDPEPEVGTERWRAAQKALDRQDWRSAQVLLDEWEEEVGVWGREGEGRMWLSEARRLRGLAWREQGDGVLAVALWHRVWSEAPGEAMSAAGISIRELALKAILDEVGDDWRRLPDSWQGMDFFWMDAVASLPRTPLAEELVERVEELAKRSMEDLPFPQQEDLRMMWLGRRHRVIGAYKALVENRTYEGDRRPWRDRKPQAWSPVMVLEMEGEVWVAMEKEVEAEDGTRTWGVYRWGGWVNRLRQLKALADPEGHFGWFIQWKGEGFALSQEEPSGVRDRVMGGKGWSLEDGSWEAHHGSIWNRGWESVEVVDQMAGRGGSIWTVGVVLLDPATYFAGGDRRRWMVYGLVMAACGVSAMAALLVWRTLVRQHRLGVAKSNLLASVSHELRAPLASVRLLADNLERDRVSEPERRRESLRLIGRECRRLGALVDNVLDLSRLERGVRRLERESTDLTTLVRETARVVEVMGEERGLRVEVELEGEPVVGWVEGRWVQQALANLLDNALKHAPEGSVVRVTLRRVGGEKVRLEVEDQGPGIPEEERERVFEPFYRRGSELRRETPGVGIGLAVVRQVAEAHGGRVWLEGVEPSGVRAVMELPVGAGGSDRSDRSDGSDGSDGSWGRLKV